ncbi:hypothetical protein JK358_27030 [Nocardia sp. 2]|uniref:Uncharacterized protein n=1 Tax=Nocardia acididurans TaxID=2802282 RepID=A0ABS1MCT9_9NOCA|nr:hypothetical protein [Nocardia acididurans]MBL1078064.1 hypothetical protein [Nocardia acididurans]
MSVLPRAVAPPATPEVAAAVAALLADATTTPEAAAPKRLLGPQGIGSASLLIELPAPAPQDPPPVAPQTAAPVAPSPEPAPQSLSTAASVSRIPRGPTGIGTDAARAARLRPSGSAADSTAAPRIPTRQRRTSVTSALRRRT